MENSDSNKLHLKRLEEACESVHQNMGTLERMFGGGTMYIKKDMNFKLMTILENESNAARRLLQLV